MFEAEDPSMVNGHSQPAPALIDESSSLLMDGDSPSRPPAAPPAATTSGLDELNGLLMDAGFLGGAPVPPAQAPSGVPLGMDDMLGMGGPSAPVSGGGLGIDDLLSGLGRNE